jgi:hypothetical protein
MARASLVDLIASGQIPVGTELYHTSRVYKDRVVTAQIVAGGIEYKGRVYQSPSGAALAVTGMVAENGWRWWRVKSSGRLLGELRRHT